jgi:hypothetical protein
MSLFLHYNKRTGAHLRYTKLSGSKCHFCLKYNRGCMMCACACTCVCACVCGWVGGWVGGCVPVHVLFHVCMCVSISMQNSAHQHPLPLSIFLEFMHTFAHLVLLLSYQPLPSLFLHDLIPAHTHPPTRPLLWLTPSSFL